MKKEIVDLIKKGDLLVLIAINGLAMTTQKTIKFDMWLIKDGENTGRFVFTELGKRKKMVYDINILSQESLLFRHEDTLAFSSDTESDVPGAIWRGNAHINLVSRLKKEELRSLIKKKCLFEPSEKTLSYILLFSPEQAAESNYEACIDNVLFPEVPCYSSLGNSIREKNS